MVNPKGTASSSIFDPELNPINAKVGATIRQLRLGRGKTQQDLSVEIWGNEDMQSTISKWERGIKRPNIESLSMIAEWARVSVSVFDVHEAKGVREADLVEARRLARRLLELLGEDGSH